MTFPRAAADALHHSTKHGTAPSHPERLVDYRRLDPANAPRRFKEYRDREPVPLPRHLTTSTLPAAEVLSGSRAPAVPLDAAVLGTLLHLAAGVTRVAEVPGRGRIYFRAAMSAGNLHPVEVYVVAGAGVDGLDAGVHHYAPLPHALTVLRRGDHRSAAATDTQAALVLTGVVWRTAWKYGERGWRHLYWDAGSMLANLLAAADGLGVSASVRIGFADAEVIRLLGIDGVAELPLAVVALGATTDPPQAVEPEPLSLDVAPVAPDPVDLPLLLDAQGEGVLGVGQVEAWRRAAASATGVAPARVDPPDEVADEPIETVILRRGSTRRMLPESIDRQRLRWPMAFAARSAPLDATPGGTLLHHFVSVHGVDGIIPGAHRWRDGNVEPIAAVDDARRTAAALCLGQPLGGDAAYTAFHHAGLDQVLGALGSRGYRAAQLEAGIASGRLALAAFAVGLGATGLTFLDDPVSEYFATATAPMLATAVGVSATAPVPGGPPGRPTRLRRWGMP